MITDQQLKRLWAAAGKLGTRADPAVHALLRLIDLDSVKQLTRKRAANVIDYLERTEPAEILAKAGITGAAAPTDGQPATEPAPIEAAEAALIAFRERAEASDDWEADVIYSEAGANAEHWRELVAVAPTIPVLNTVTGHVKRRGLFNVEMSEAISARQRALRERAEQLSR